MENAAESPSKIVNHGGCWKENPQVDLVLNANSDDCLRRHRANPSPAEEMTGPIPKTGVGKFDKKVLREQFKEWQPKEQVLVQGQTSN